jgi:hypothetical protein
MESKEFYELFLKPCLICPNKYIVYRKEIEEEWTELRRYHLTLEKEYTAEERKWMTVCLATLRLLGR